MLSVLLRECILFKLYTQLTHLYADLYQLKKTAKTTDGSSYRAAEPPLDLISSKPYIATLLGYGSF